MRRFIELNANAAVGGDPGSQGCLCLIPADRQNIKVIRLIQIDEKNLSSHVQWDWGMNYKARAAVEAVHSMPKDKKNTAFAFGRNFGIMESALWISNFEIDYVDSQVWLRHFGLYGLPSHYRREGMTDDKASRQAKRDYRDLAQKIFVDFTVTLDMADGMLLAEFEWIKLFGHTDFGQEYMRNRNYLKPKLERKKPNVEFWRPKIKQEE